MINSLENINNHLLDCGFSMNEKSDFKSREVKYYLSSNKDILVNQTKTDNSIILDYWMYDVLIKSITFDFYYKSIQDQSKFKRMLDGFLDESQKYIDFFKIIKTISDLKLRRFSFERFKNIPQRFHVSVHIKSDIHLADENLQNGSILFECYLPSDKNLTYFIYINPDLTVHYQIGSDSNDSIDRLELMINNMFY